MSVITLEDFTPIPRYDGKPWTEARIEEAPSNTGPWTVLETQALTPVDSDPEEPMARSFTTELATAISGLWYRLVFLDADGDVQLPTEPLHNVLDEDLPYLPTVGAVASLLRARTKNEFGQEIGSFTSKTRPTPSQVAELIQLAADEIISSVDLDALPPEMLDDLQNLIALRAAMMVELSFFPEQIGTDRSPYDRLERLYLGPPSAPETGALQRFLSNVQRELTEDVGEGVTEHSPLLSFPDPNPNWMGRVW